MGIPSYFSTIKRKYAKKYNKWMIPELPQNTCCKHLYIDMNGIVHTCGQRIVSNYEKSISQSYSSLSYTQLEQLVGTHVNTIYESVLQPFIFNMILHELQQLFDTVQPTDLMFLALDGVAPRAKMEQQRQRRHRSVNDKIVEKTIYHRHKKAYLKGLLWDSNCVTPGTSFMKELGDFLHEHVHTLKVYGNCKIIFSDTKEHGEGEHKIMDHMRNHGTHVQQDVSKIEDKHDVQEAFVLYGQDADLIMLGLGFLSQYKTPLYLLREIQYSSCDEHTSQDEHESKQSQTKLKTCSLDDTTALYQWKPCSTDSSTESQTNAVQFLDIYELQLQIIHHIESYGDLFTHDEHARVIKDYVCLCFLLGNDFLPHSPSLCIQDKGIDVLLEIYVPLRKQHGRFLTYSHCNEDSHVQETHIHQAFFSAILQKLAQQEDYLAGRLHTNTLQKRKWMLQQQRHPKDASSYHQEPVNEENHMSNTTQQQYTIEHDLRHVNTLQPSLWVLDDKILPGTPGWKRRYYVEIERISNMQDVHNMCKAYMEGLFWTLQYYFHGCYSTLWYYPYISTPLFSNLEFVIHQPRFNINRLIKRYTAWTYNSISQLLTIMPKESLLKYVYTQKNTIMLQEHVISYPMVPFSKRFKWECPVRLPMVNEAHIMEVAQQLSC